MEGTAPPKPTDPNDLSAFKMDEYDEEESQGVAMGAFANVKGLAFYRDNNDDPYITLKEASSQRLYMDVQLMTRMTKTRKKSSSSYLQTPCSSPPAPPPTCPHSTFTSTMTLIHPSLLTTTSCSPRSLYVSNGSTSPPARPLPALEAMSPWAASTPPSKSGMRT